MTGRKCDQVFVLGVEEGFAADHECARSLVDKGHEGRIYLLGSSRMQDYQGYAEDACGHLHIFRFSLGLEGIDVQTTGATSHEARHLGPFMCDI
jgi:hypothetical protein